ncbi:MAG TPA: hypothetical protein VFN31_02940 [Candidatus Saccharimonadales bacterium]|nr:hypothetical protein [Candidatus Saccharimonadales bacterium]
MELHTTEINGTINTAELELQGLEEIIAAQAAVQNVHGQDHPLLNPESAHINLRTPLMLGMPIKKLVIKEPASVETIVGSLLEVAEDETDIFTNTARYMLSQAGIDAPPLKPREDIQITDSDTVETTPSDSYHENPDPIITDRYVELKTYEGRVTALRAVGDFAEGETKEVATQTLLADIEIVSPHAIEPTTYEYPLSEVIVSCLVKAAVRGETFYDETAMYMINKSLQNNTAVWSQAA